MATETIMNAQTTNGSTSSTAITGGIYNVSCEGTVEGTELVTLLHRPTGKTEYKVAAQFSAREIGNISKNIRLDGAHDVIGNLQGVGGSSSISLYLTQ